MDLCGGQLPDFQFNIVHLMVLQWTNPQILLTVYPRQNSGTTYQSNVDQPNCDRQFLLSVEQFTGQIYTRVARTTIGVFKSIRPNQGVFWQWCDAV